MVMFDTDIVIAMSRGNQDARAAYLKHAKTTRPVISCMTWFELLSGVCRVRSPKNQLKTIHDCLSDVGIMHFDDTTATLAGKYAAMQADRGRPIGLIDTLIAASCVVNGHTLITRNTKHFEGIPGLKIEAW